jgi:hypothetical protein
MVAPGVSVAMVKFTPTMKVKAVGPCHGTNRATRQVTSTDDDDDDDDDGDHDDVDDDDDDAAACEAGANLTAFLLDVTKPDAIQVMIRSTPSPLIFFFPHVVRTCSRYGSPKRRKDGAVTRSSTVIVLFTTGLSAIPSLVATALNVTDLGGGGDGGE